MSPVNQSAGPLRVSAELRVICTVGLPLRVRWVRGSGPQEGLDGAALVHRRVAVGGLLQRQFEVEDLARVDGAVPDQVDELGQEASDRGGAAVQVHAGEEQLLTGQLYAVRDADVADVPAGPGRAD